MFQSARMHVSNHSFLTKIKIYLRVQKYLIHVLRLIVSLILLPQLLLEPESLFKGIVQLGISVADLLGAQEGFETLA